MNNVEEKIGFGGGCHWCTEAVFQHVNGVANVEQGWIASAIPNDAFSEAVIVHYNPQQVSLRLLIHIHLITHSSASAHPLRGKYRSAIYYFNDESRKAALASLGEEGNDRALTQVLPFNAFKANKESYKDYYLKNPESQFCQRYIEPKLKIVRSTTKSEG